MLQGLQQKNKKITVTGLGYVGLPLALEFAKKYSVIAYDSSSSSIQMLQKGLDPSNELAKCCFEDVEILFTNDPADLREGHFHIIAVPTDIDKSKTPDLAQLFAASKTIGSILKEGDYVVFESTVYPGCTEEDCIPILENESNLKMGDDFKVGYSPERIVPGDTEKTLSNITKVVSANDTISLEVTAQVYQSILQKQVYQAESIKVAELSKLLENAQRDLNISLMNELSIISRLLGIDTSQVIEAASTKWNFHKYAPGLVGGHCISVDPFYLIHKSRQFGHDPQVIAAGRRVNDYIPHFIAKEIVQKLISLDKKPNECKVLVMGVTFKENVSDIRNSKVIDLINALWDYYVEVDVIDPNAEKESLENQYGISLTNVPHNAYNLVVLAVPHKEYVNLEESYFTTLMPDQPVLFDVKGVYRNSFSFDYWKL